MNVFVKTTGELLGKYLQIVIDEMLGTCVVFMDENGNVMTVNVTEIMLKNKNESGV